MIFSETLTVRRLKALSLLPYLLLTGACSDSMTPDQDRYIADALSAANECRETICAQQFWDNPACAQAFAAWNDTPTDWLERDTDPFAMMHSHLESQWRQSYIESLERESGHTIGVGGSRCGTKTLHRFDALKSERMNRTVTE